MSISLCTTSEIPDPGSKGFTIKQDKKAFEIFIVHKDASFHAYINSCPHTGANLEWLEDQFLDMENTFIQCSTHDALFEVDSGLCIYGPCTGKSLTKIPLEIINNQIIVHNVE